jgi:hypothetical protein
LIDDYDQIQRDFEPFYQLAEENPAHFADMIDRGRAMVCSPPSSLIFCPRISCRCLRIPKE